MVNVLARMPEVFLKLKIWAKIAFSGNKYFLNNDYPMGRNRFVVYAENNFEQRYDFDASDIPAEWHR